MGFPRVSEVKASASNVGDLGQQDLLEKEMATHASILAWKIAWTEKPGGLNQVGRLELVTKQHQTMENTQSNNCVFH